MKVLFLTSSAEQFGSERALLELAVQLRARGVDSLTLFPDSGPATEAFARSLLRVEVMPEAMAVLTRASLRRAPGLLRHATVPSRGLLNAARSFAPDIVYSNTTHVLDGPALARRLGVPHIWHIREIERIDPAAQRTWGRILTVTGHCIAISRSVACQVVGPRLRGCLDHGVTIVHDGVAAENYPFCPVKDAVDATSELLVPARYTEWKGQDLILEAFLRSCWPGSLRLVGSAASERDRRWLDAAVLPLVRQAEGRVILDGPVENMPALYGRAHAVISGARSPEPFGRTMVEAMLSGPVAIGPDEGGPSEIVRPGVDGLIYRARCVEGLAQTMDVLAGMPPGRRAGMANRARERAICAFSIEACTDKVHEVLCRVTGHVAA